MDTLSRLALEYNDTGELNNYEKIKNSIQPIMNSVLNKWNLYYFPNWVKEKARNDGISLVLLEALEYYKPEKGSKFTSVFGTTFEYYIMKTLLKYMRKTGEEEDDNTGCKYNEYSLVQKRSGIFKEHSFEEKIGEDIKLEDTIGEEHDLDLDKKELHEAINSLDDESIKILNDLYFNNRKRKDVIKEMDLTYPTLKKRERKILSKLKECICA